jgi:excisionase family DNA binding protein
MGHVEDKHMPAIKSNSTKSKKNGKHLANEFGDVLTLGEAASYLRIGEGEVVRAVQSQGLPARQIGAEWRFSKCAIQNWLAGTTLKSNKQVLLNLAGKFRDDPYLKEITREAYERRSLPANEDGE